MMTCSVKKANQKINDEYSPEIPAKNLNASIFPLFLSFFQAT